MLYLTCLFFVTIFLWCYKADTVVSLRRLHTYILLTLYSRRDSRGISDILRDACVLPKLGGKPIAVWSQSTLGVSAINPLVAFYDIHGIKREVLLFYGCFCLCILIYTCCTKICYKHNTSWTSWKWLLAAALSGLLRLNFVVGLRRFLWKNKNIILSRTPHETITMIMCS
jgi:hypothetical protein